MGNNQVKKQKTIPEKGYRINNISKKSLLQKLDLLTDYILFPDPKEIDLRKDFIKFQVYSVLTTQIRTVELPILNRELGLQLRLQQINECVLRITKIFKGSPFQKHNVLTNQFIVGVIEGQFSCIKSFAQLVRKITVMNPKGFISLGICSIQGRTRIVEVFITELKAWSIKGKGLLGCQLAQGWIHRWKPFKEQLKIQKNQEKVVNQKSIQIPIIKQFEGQGERKSESSDEIDVKCDSIDKGFDESGIKEVKFKGFLKGEQMIDASNICRCKPLNKECQKCFIQKDSNFYFFNKKTSQIMTIPNNLMILTNE